MMDELLKGLARALAENARDNQSGTDSVLIAEQERVLREVGLGELLEAAEVGANLKAGSSSFSETQSARDKLRSSLARVRAALAGAEKGREGK